MLNAETRKERRLKRKSENMFKNLLLIIHHYDKCFFEDMKKIKDPRNQVYIAIRLKEKIKTLGKEIKEALRCAQLDVNDYVEILTPIQVRREISY